MSPSAIDLYTPSLVLLKPIQLAPQPLAAFRSAGGIDLLSHEEEEEEEAPTLVTASNEPEPRPTLPSLFHVAPSVPSSAASFTFSATSSASLFTSPRPFSHLTLTRSRAPSEHSDMSLDSASFINHNNKRASPVSSDFVPIVKKNTNGHSSYACPFEGCTKEFTEVYNLKAHFFLHSNVRPYQCQHCSADFARLRDQQRHERSVHGGKKEFVCEGCGGEFARRDSLQRHLRNVCCTGSNTPAHR